MIRSIMCLVLLGLSSLSSFCQTHCGTRYFYEDTYNAVYDGKYCDYKATQAFMSPGGGTTTSTRVSNGLYVTWNGIGTGNITYSVFYPAGALQQTHIGNKTVQVPVTAAEQPTFITAPASICNGQTLTFNASSPSASSYSWEVSGGLSINGATTATTTMGSVQVTAPTTGNTQGYVKVKANSVCGSTPVTTKAVWIGYSFSVSGPSKVCTSNFTFRGSIIGGKVIGWNIYKSTGEEVDWPGYASNDGSAFTITFTPPLGQYYVTSVATSCGKTVYASLPFSVVSRTACSGTSATSNPITFNINTRPNPASNQFYVEAIDEDGNVVNTSFEVELADRYSQVKKLAKSHSGSIKIDTHSLSSGIYYLKIIQKNEMTTKQIVIQK